jgi:hypothetical protein
MTMTATIAETHLDAWLAADLALTRNRSYTMEDGRTLTRTDTPFVKERISYWQRTLNALRAETAGAKNPGIKVATWS